VERAAVNLQPGKELRIKQAAVKRTVRPRERQTVDEQGDAAAGGRAVETGAANGEARGGSKPPKLSWSITPGVCRRASANVAMLRPDQSAAATTDEGPSVDAK
jgi:hypothetical protein